MDSYVFSLADEFQRLRDEKKRIEAHLKETNEALAGVESKLADAMAGEEIQNFTRAGITFYQKSRMYASPEDGQKEALYKALRTNGYGDLITETIPAQSLTAFAKELRGESADPPSEWLPSWLGGLVKVYEKPGVGARKS